MACNNFNKNTGLSQTLDINVAYTGCEHECNGFTIQPGMNIRVILDALLSNCAGTPTPVDEVPNFWFGIDAPVFGMVANLNDYYLQSNGQIWQYQVVTPGAAAVWVDTEVNISGTGAEWGSITGDINAQTDLLAFIQENALSADKIGYNLNLNELGEVNAGVDLSALLPPGTKALAFSESGTLNLAEGEKNYVLLISGSMSGSFDNSISLLSEAAGELNITTDQQSSYLRLKTPFNLRTVGRLSINGGLGESYGLFMEDSGDCILSANISGKTGIHGNTIEIGKQTGSDVTQDLEVSGHKTKLFSEDGNLRAGISVQGVRAGQSYDFKIGYDIANESSFSGILITKRPVNNDGNHQINIVSGQLQSQYSTFITYDRPLPATAPDLALVPKQYVDALQSQVTALEARVAALEGA